MPHAILLTLVVLSIAAGGRRDEDHSARRSRLPVTALPGVMLPVTVMPTAAPAAEAPVEYALEVPACDPNAPKTGSPPTTYCRIENASAILP
jgi:hypothetical protein